VFLLSSISDRQPSCLLYVRRDLKEKKKENSAKVMEVHYQIELGNNIFREISSEALPAAVSVH
jgi:hypothetical protein